MPMLSSPSRPNAQRHAPNCAKKPPSAGPNKAPTPHVEAVSAEPRLQSLRGSTALITAKLSPHNSPPASPWKRRPTSKMPMFGAIAQIRLPAPSTEKPETNGIRAPTRCSSALTVAAATTDPTR